LNQQALELQCVYRMLAFPVAPIRRVPYRRLLMLVATAASSSEARWQQSRFTISFWVDPLVAPAKFDARYAEIAAANFSVVLGGFGATTPASVAAQLAACEKHDLKAVVSSCGGGSAGPGACSRLRSPALWGFSTNMDEPPGALFANLSNWSKAVAAIDPELLRFVNIRGLEATIEGAPTYDGYVERFVKELQPDLLCTDFYPIFRSRSYPTFHNQQDYLNNLGVLRKHALLANIPFWNFFSSMPFASHPDPTE
jgi:hypothetical protein